MSKVYPVHRFVNRAVEYRGLQAQYIWYMAGGLMLLLIGFAASYLAGLPPYPCLVAVLVAGGVLTKSVYRLSKRHGRYGLMKKRATRRIPRVIKSRTRIPFMLQETMEPGAE